MRRLHPVLAVLLGLSFGPTTRADDGERAAPAAFAAERFYRDVRALVRRHYRAAAAHRLGDRIHFEHDTRIFLIHDALKTGEWQDPREERGPRMHGVMGDLEFRRGEYGGAAAVPQTFDKRYFKVLLYAPYAKRLDGHLHVHLKIPGNGRPPDGFVGQFEALVARFGEYVESE